MTNETIPNVPRELLERIIQFRWIADDLEVKDCRKELRALLSAPSPAGVDGLEVIGWYTDDHLDDKSATTYSRKVADRWLAKGWPVTGIANESAAQAIIDGLRGEVDKLMTTFVRVADHLHIDCEKAKSAPGKPSDVFIAAIDQHVKRIGELEQILRDLVPGCKWRFMRPRIDAALSACKEGEL